MTFDRRRARLVVMTMWSAFFVWLWVSGEMTRFLGPRTYWVVPFGAAALGVAALAGVATSRHAPAADAGLGARDAIGVVVMLVPMIAIAAVPGAQLGSLAATNKASTGLLATAGASLAVPSSGDGAVSFRDIYYANQSEEYALKRGIGEGLEMELEGFVTRAPDGESDSLQLTRFYVSCCAADAIPYSVTVASRLEDGVDYEQDAWLRVDGVLTRSEEGFVVEAAGVENIPTPQDPYLY